MEEFCKEIAKMLLGIVKYLVTGIILTTMIGGLEDNRIIYVIAMAMIVFCSFVSWLLYSIIDNRNKININNKRRK